MIVDDFETIADNYEKLFGAKRTWQFRPSHIPTPDVLDIRDGCPVYETIEFTEQDILDLMAAAGCTSFLLDADLYGRLR